MSGKGCEIGILKRWLQNPRSWARRGISDDTRMHTVRAMRRVADEMALPKRGKLAARDHNLPDLSIYASEKSFGNTMDNELSIGNQGNIRGHSFDIGNNVCGKNNDPLPGELR